MKLHEINDELDKIKKMIQEFDVQFVDEEIFRGFINSILDPPQHGYLYFPGHWSWKNTLIMGYFDEAVVKPLNKIAESNIRRAEGGSIKLLSPKLNIKETKDKRDKISFDALRKLDSIETIECRINEKSHSRFFLQYNELTNTHKGYILMGSFDFNKEGIVGTRRDTGFFTQNPEMLKIVKEYFLKCWDNPHDTFSLDDYQKK